MNIGIVTSFYNHYDRFLPAWVDSICNLKTKPDFVSVVASGNNYDVENIEYVKRVLDIASIPFKIDYVNHRGMGYARNKAVENSPTEWIVYLDVDDVILYDAIDNYNKYETMADVICGGLLIEQTNGENTHILFNASKERALKGGWVSCSHGAYKKKFWTISPYITHNDYVDQVLWLGFAQNGAEFIGTKELCTVYKRRLDGHNFSMTPEMKTEQKTQWEKYVKYGIDSETIELYHYDCDINFGDLLSPIIVEWIANKKVVSVFKEQKGKLVALGSLASCIRENDMVWGTGFISDANIDLPDNIRILSLRGPLSRQKVKNHTVPEVYGDPALLMPQIYKPEIEKKYKIGVVSHYVDTDRFNIKEHLWIDVTNPDPLETINQMLSCEKIVSTSLHGIIVAEAYGIPAIWLKVGNKVIGGNFKFHDYLLSTGRPALDPVVVTGIVDDTIITQIQDRVLPKPIINVEPMLEAFKEVEKIRKSMVDPSKSIKLSISIMAHPSRAHLVDKIKAKMNEDIHVEWDKGKSLWHTARRAWLSYDATATHHLVLQDDILPSVNLKATLEKALQYKSDVPISIFLGKHRLTVKGEQRYHDYHIQGIPWFENSASLDACGIIVPIKYIQKMVQFGDNMDNPADDTKIQAFFNRIHVPIWNTVPSLIEYRDGKTAPSIIQQNKDWKDRSAIIFIGENNSGINLNWGENAAIKVNKEINLSITIMAHPSRAQWVEQIKEKIGGEIQVVWDRGLGLWDTAKRAWLSYDPNATHHLVLQDDIIPSLSLRETIEKATLEYPDFPISLFLGKNRLPPEAERLYKNHYKYKVPWFMHGSSLAGCGVIVPVKLIKDMIDQTDTMSYPADDMRIEAYFKNKQIPILNTVPSLINHRNGEEVPSLSSKQINSHDRSAILFIGEDQSGFDLKWEQKDLPPLIRR